MKRKYLIMFMLGAFLMVPTNSDAQFFKKLGDAISKGVGNVVSSAINGTNKAQEVQQNSNNSRSTSKSTPQKDPYEDKEAVYDTNKDYLDPIKPINQEETGWQLVHKNKNGSWDVEHYEKGNVAIRTFVLNDQYFASFLEDPSGNYNNTSNVSSSNLMGNFKSPLFDDGSFVEGRILEKKWDAPDDGLDRLYDVEQFRYHFPNGNMFVGSRVVSYPLSATTFFSHELDYKYLIKQYRDWDSDHWNTNSFRGAEKEGYRKFFVFHDNPDKCYVVDGQCMIYKDGRACIIYNNGELGVVAQKVGKNYIYANETDTIVSCQDGVIKYSNGDELTLKRVDGELYVQGKIHRNGGVIDAREINGTPRTRLTMPNGDFFTGSFEECKIRGIEVTAFSYEALKFSELTPYNGTWNRGGKIEEVVNGQNKSDIERARKQREQEEAAQDAAKIKQWSNKYGDKYAKAMVQGKILTGTPIQLIKEYISYKREKDPGARGGITFTELSCTSNDILRYGRTVKKYNLNTLGINQVIWATNGRVVAISDAFL